MNFITLSGMLQTQASLGTTRSTSTIESLAFTSELPYADFGSGPWPWQNNLPLLGKTCNPWTSQGADSRGMASVDACKRQCALNQDCVAFNWVPNNATAYKCFLFSSCANVDIAPDPLTQLWFVGASRDFTRVDGEFYCDPAASLLTLSSGGKADPRLCASEALRSNAVAFSWYSDGREAACQMYASGGCTGLSSGGTEYPTSGVWTFLYRPIKCNDGRLVAYASTAPGSCGTHGGVKQCPSGTAMCDTPNCGPNLDEFCCSTDCVNPSLGGRRTVERMTRMQIVNTGGPIIPPFILVDPLPMGVSFDSTTGEFSGRPTRAAGMPFGGPLTYRIKASGPTSPGSVAIVYDLNATFEA